MHRRVVNHALCAGVIVLMFGANGKADAGAKARRNRAPRSSRPSPTSSARTNLSTATTVAPTRVMGDRIVAPTSPRSFLAQRQLVGEVPASEMGSLFEVTSNGAHGRFLVSMLATDAASLVPNPGWSINFVGKDPTWTPARCGAMPNAVIGNRWLVLFDLQPGSNDPSGAGAAGADPATVPRLLLTVYDTQARTYRNLRPVNESVFEHTGSLRPEGDHEFSYLYSPAGGASPILIRRLIDVSNDTFIDQPIALPADWRVAGIFKANGDLRADLRDPSGQKARTGAVIIDPTGGGRVDLLPVDAAVPPYAVDGFRIRVEYKPDTSTLADDFDVIVDESGRERHRFPHDQFDQVLLRRTIDETVFFSYRRPDSQAVTSQDLGILDLTTGTVATAFANRRAAAPSMVVGESAEAFIAGVERLSP